MRFWDPAAPQKPVREITAPFLGRQTALLFLDGGKRLLVADSVPTQIGRLHDITLDPESVKTFDTAHRDSIFTLTLSADGKRYASTSADKLIVVRDTTKHEVVKRLEGHTGYVLAAAFSPDGDGSPAGDDEEIKVWNLETGRRSDPSQATGAVPSTGSPGSSIRPTENGRPRKRTKRRRRRSTPISSSRSPSRGSPRLSPS